MHRRARLAQFIPWLLEIQACSTSARISVALLVLLCSGDAAAQTWVPTDIGFPDHDLSEATDVADNGTVVGFYSEPSGTSGYVTRGFVWTRDSGWTTLGGSMTLASAVNNGQGLVVADFDGDGRDEIVVGFGAAGLWKNSNNAWTFLNPLPVSALVASRIH